MPPGHLLVGYHHETERDEVVRQRLQSGRREPSRQLGYFAWIGRDGVTDSLRGLVGTEAGRAVRIVSLDEYFTAAEPPDPGALVRFWDDVSREATVAGFGGLVALIDTTPWISDPDTRAGFLRGEHFVDRYCLDHSLELICMCRASALDPRALDELACIHPQAEGVSVPFHLHASAAADLAVAGEIDAFTVPLLDRILDALDPRAPGETLVIDGAQLGFLGHHTLLALEDHAERHELSSVVLRTSLQPAAQMSLLLDLRRVHVELVERRR